MLPGTVTENIIEQSHPERRRLNNRAAGAVTDRWHLLKNLGEAIHKIVIREYAKLNKLLSNNSVDQPIKPLTSRRLTRSVKIRKPSGMDIDGLSVGITFSVIRGCWPRVSGADSSERHPDVGRHVGVRLGIDQAATNQFVLLSLGHVAIRVQNVIVIISIE